MNRIILIGNGFDLAHDLKTSYNDFIDDYWKKKIENFITNYPQFNDSDIAINNIDPMQYPPKGYINTFDEFTDFLQRHYKATIRYKNRFLETITQKRYLQNWVDIEREYYAQIKQILNNKIGMGGYKITDLNRDFDIIKNALKQYLLRVIEPQPIDGKIKKIESQIYNEFDLRDITNKGVERIIEEQWVHYQKLLKEKEKTEEKRYNNRDSALLEHNVMDKNSFNRLIRNKSQIKEYFWLIPDSILFLNFNYTPMEYFYDKYKLQKQFNSYEYDEQKINTDIIHIHGELKKSYNPIIFGYGDELDKDYSTIEQLNDNDFLENIKSINYSRTDSYKRLLDFINLDNYQIFIFGHSCGISDRTLLNILFEHDNCVSIKAFYRVKEDGSDNFDDIIKNISRNFTNKAVMREKVVNKMYSESFIEK